MLQYVREPKPDNVNILSITATCGESKDYVYGLGEDGRVYFWGMSKVGEGWFLNTVRLVDDSQETPL